MTLLLCVLATQGKFQVVRSGHSLTTEKLVQRIVERRLDYENRNAKKEKKEMAAYQALMRSKQMQAAEGDKDCSGDI